MKLFLTQLFNILTLKERKRLFVAAACDLLIGIADVVFLVALLLMVRVYTSASSAAPASKYDSLLANTSPVTVTGIFLILFCLKNIVGVMVAKSQYQYIYGVASRLSGKNISNYLTGSYTDFVNVDSSRRIRHISSVPIEFSTYILSNFQQIIAQSILVILTVAAILIYHPVLFVLLLVLLLPPVILLGWFVKLQLRKVRMQIKTNSAKVIQYLQEALSGFVESNIYNKGQFFSGRYHQYQQQMNQNIAVQQTYQGLSSRFFEVFALFGFFVLITINKWHAGAGSIDLLTIGVFMAAAYKIIPGIVKILNSAGQIKTYSFIMDDLTADEAYPEIGTLSYPESIQTISFNDVCFKYKDGVLLDGINFEINRGDMAGISGISGKGKTTIINLLLGFLQQDAGGIAINGQPLDNLKRKTYWPSIAYVKQQSFFINDSILKNITLSDVDYDEERLAQAVKLSGLNTFLANDATGIHKVIREHGKNISGGQRQRIALARALYKRFDLLILDEPFSEMDHEAEDQLLQQIKDIANSGKMVILITHNRASLNYCNLIISPYATA